MSRTAEFNTAGQVIQSMACAFSVDPADAESNVVPVASDVVKTVAIRSIATAQARELVVFAQANVAMNLDINLVSINGIDDFTVSTTLLPANTATRIIVAGGLGTAVQIQVFLAVAAPPVGLVRVVAYARA